MFLLQLRVSLKSKQIRWRKIHIVTHAQKYPLTKIFVMKYKPSCCKFCLAICNLSVISYRKESLNATS